MSVIETPLFQRGRSQSEASVGQSDSRGDGQLAALRLRPGLVSSDIAPMIARATQFPMDTVLSRYMADHNTDAETAVLYERELKRFLVCGAVFDNPIGMRGNVDDLWHTFVLFTRDYRQFCQDVCGVFIDHVPHTAEALAASGKSAGYIYFHAAYRTLFGHVPPAPPWPHLNEPDARACQACTSASAADCDTYARVSANTDAGGDVDDPNTVMFFSDDTCSVCVGMVEGRKV